MILDKLAKKSSLKGVSRGTHLVLLVLAALVASQARAESTMEREANAANEYYKKRRQMKNPSPEEVKRLKDSTLGKSFEETNQQLQGELDRVQTKYGNKTINPGDPLPPQVIEVKREMEKKTPLAKASPKALPPIGTGPDGAGPGNASGGSNSISVESVNVPRPQYTLEAKDIPAEIEFQGAAPKAVPSPVTKPPGSARRPGSSK